MKAGTSFLKRVAGRIIRNTVVINLIETSKNFIFNFLHKKTAKYCENFHRSNKKPWLLGPPIKYLSRATISFKTAIII
jgi:hypothetical protein